MGPVIGRCSGKCRPVVGHIAPTICRLGERKALIRANTVPSVSPGVTAFGYRLGRSTREGATVKVTGGVGLVTDMAQRRRLTQWF